jgi:hypothetical protein
MSKFPFDWKEICCNNNIWGFGISSLDSKNNSGEELFTTIS